MHREPQSSGRPSARPGPVQRRPRGPAASAEEILELQRAAGNRAAIRAIQRGVASDALGQLGSLTAAGATGGGVVGGARSSDALSTSGGLGTGVSAGVTVLTDLPVAYQQGRDAAAAWKDRRKAKESGSLLSMRAAVRAWRMKATDFTAGLFKDVTVDATQAAGGAGAAAQYTHAIPDVVGAGIATGTAGAALPAQVFAVVRSGRSLFKKNFQERNLQRLLDDPVWPASAQDAVDRRTKIAQEVALAQRRVAEEEAVLDGAEGLLPYFGELPFATAEAAAARDELEAAKRELQGRRAELAKARERKKKADETARIMRDEITGFDPEVRKLVQGEKPSPKAIAYYAHLQSARGWRRRLIKLASDTVGLGGGIAALIAAAVAATAVSMGWVGVVLAALATIAGLGLGTWKAWSLLAKRWGVVKDAYVDTGKTDKDGKPVYKEIRGFFRKVGTIAGHKKVYSKLADGSYEEIKSDRTLMAEALWDYATNPEYEKPVHDQAWKIIETLTRSKGFRTAGQGKFSPGMTEDEMLRPDPRRSDQENQEISAKQKEDAIKLFEDKLKSA